ncbi:MAG: amidohydrolase family protein, partial [Spirochaetaceae bacterium]|nr:amidohydrolase family protein [Spirochaetaceae bacterium]
MKINMGPNKSSADTIYCNGKILTVDGGFSIVEAVSISGDRFLSTGSDKEILQTADKDTVLVDLAGRTVIPGIIDSHAHPTWAALSELSGKVPIIQSLDDLFDWISGEVVFRPTGEWIVLPYFFISRIREQAYPLLRELDAISPEHPVFLNGAYSGMVNS